jgi:DNA polymerase III alpha subunit
VDPARMNVLFERFISRERNEPPDIDIDFEHHRREEVIQYLYRKIYPYGMALSIANYPEISLCPGNTPMWFIFGRTQ